MRTLAAIAPLWIVFPLVASVATFISLPSALSRQTQNRSQSGLPETTVREPQPAEHALQRR